MATDMDLIINAIADENIRKTVRKIVKLIVTDLGTIKTAGDTNKTNFDAHGHTYVASGLSGVSSIPHTSGVAVTSGSGHTAYTQSALLSAVSLTE